VTSEKRQFFDFNWLPWQRPLKNQKRGPDLSYSNKYLSGPNFGAKIAKIVQYPEILVKLTARVLQGSVDTLVR